MILAFNLPSVCNVRIETVIKTSQSETFTIFYPTSSKEIAVRLPYIGSRQPAGKAELINNQKTAHNHLKRHSLETFDNHISLEISSYFLCVWFSLKISRFDFFSCIDTHEVAFSKAKAQRTLGSNQPISLRLTSLLWVQNEITTVCAK